MTRVVGTFILEDGRTTPSCPFCRRYDHAGHAANCPIHVLELQAVVARDEALTAAMHAVDRALEECARQGCSAQVLKEARTTGLLGAKTSLRIPASDNYSGVSAVEPRPTCSQCARGTDHNLADCDTVQPALLDSPEVVEVLAALEHARWAHWMEYLYACCSWKEDPERPKPVHGQLPEPPVNVKHLAVIPADKVDRWQRQMETAYADLSEKEKESDRVEARKTLIALRTLLAGHKP